MKCFLCEKDVEEVFAIMETDGICESCIPAWLKPIDPPKLIEPKRKVVAKPRTKKLTEAQFRKMCRDAGQDWMADNKGDESGLDLSQVAYDLADSLLHDPGVREYVLNHFGYRIHASEPPYYWMKTYVAEMICD